MAHIFSIFARRDNRSLEGQGHISGHETNFEDDNYNHPKIPGFGSLAKSQQLLDCELSLVLDGLAETQALIGRVSDVRSILKEMSEKHRRLSLDNLALQQKMELTLKDLDESNSRIEELSRDKCILEESINNTTTSLTEIQNDFESLQQIHHCLQVSKEELEADRSDARARLSLAEREIEELGLDLSTFKASADSKEQAIIELESHNSDLQSRLLAYENNIKSLEMAIAQREENINDLSERLNTLVEDHNSLIETSKQNEQRYLASEARLSEIIDKNNSESRSREKKLNAVVLDLERANDNVKTLEVLNSRNKLENERLLAQVRHYEVESKKLENMVASLDRNLSRVSADLESTNAAKAQLDKSRTALANRVDVLSRALRTRETDIDKLKGELGLKKKELNEKQIEVSAVVEKFTDRVNALERDLATQREEAVYYAAQLETLRDKKIQQ